MSDNNDLSKSGDHPPPPASSTQVQETDLDLPVDNDTEEEDNSTLADTLQSLRDMGPPSAHGSPEAGYEGAAGDEGGVGGEDNPFEGLVEGDEGVMEEMMDFGENDFDQDTLANLAALSKFGQDGEEGEGGVDAVGEAGDGQGDVDFSLFLPPMEDGFGMDITEAVETIGEELAQDGQDAPVDAVAEGKAAEGEEQEKAPDASLVIPEVTLEEQLFNEGVIETPAQDVHANLSTVAEEEQPSTAEKLIAPQTPAVVPSASNSEITARPSPPIQPVEKDIGPLDIPEPPSQSAGPSFTLPTSKAPATRESSPQRQTRDETELRDVNEIGQESAYGMNGDAGEPRERDDGEDEQEDDRDEEDEEFMGMDPKYVYEDGRLKRKRNRTTL